MSPEKYAARFWSRLVARDTGRIDGPCMEWSGTRDKDGYGQTYPWQGHRRPHRIAWFLTNGPIPNGLWVLHKCDNPPCCNPNHLFLGTPLANARDCVEKGRRPRGTDHHMSRHPERARRGSACHQAKLTEESVQQIKILVAVCGYNQSEIAREFGVTPGAVWRIMHNKNWRNHERRGT